jgi:16S rRNA (guanine966-N2)-methyltransferase
VRIIGGTHRSRIVTFPDAEGLRPTPDRVRETLFNWLGQDMTGKRCLDLFAGSGALGLEAASRGASEVVMIEKNRAVFRVLQENIKKLNFNNIALRNEDGLNFAGRGSERFDLIFLDPPFQSDFFEKLLPLLSQQLSPQGFLYVESGTQLEAAEPWKIIKHGRAGAVHYQLLQLEQSS